MHNKNNIYVIMKSICILMNSIWVLLNNHMKNVKISREIKILPNFF